jgi:hypothetical protein
MPRVRLQKVQFGQDGNAAMWKHVEDNARYWLDKTRHFRTVTLKKYARLYKGVPLQENKSTPWPNASNNVIQVIATHCDQLLARVMALYLVQPLWPVKLLGDLDEAEEATELKDVMEGFLGDAAFDTDELDMYRTEQTWFSGACRNGTSIVKTPYKYEVEYQLADVLGIDSAGYKPVFKDWVKYDGPRPTNVPLNKFVTNLNYSKLRDSPFKFEIATLSRFQLQERVELGLYDQKKVDRILGQPDNNVTSSGGSGEVQQFIERTQGIQDSPRAEVGDEFDILEVEFDYWHNGQKFSLRAHLHLSSNTHLLAYYNYYPDNLSIFEDAKLAYDDEQYLGYGLAEMLKGYQDEISTIHNQRIDAGTLNNTTAFRINKNSKLRSILTFYPGVMVPADPQEIERIDTSNPYATNTDSENLTTAYAQQRSGIDPAIGGAGGGIVNPKRGVYSAQGTFAVMQQQNNRTSLRTSDMRNAHTRVGDKIAKIYAKFGLGSKIRSYGTDAAMLARAFEHLANGKLGILIRPSSASINKEMEKQNDLLLTQHLERLYAGDAQVIQVLSTQGIPPELKQYYMDMLKAKNILMKHILRSYGHEDINELIPVPMFLKTQRKGVPNVQATGGGAGVPGLTQQPQQALPTVPGGGIPATLSVPTGGVPQQGGGASIQ